ncbi:hypothetical protein KHQ82_08970 [Mycoplasmatota bacterium]|nr:hypothetical protein KHQ82_08970 [Mycoplasmatota bacterium]
MGLVKMSKKEAQAIRDIVAKYSAYETPLIEILHEINGIYKGSKSRIGVNSINE